MGKKYHIPHDSVIVLLPEPEKIIKYLKESELWSDFVHRKNPDITGFLCVKKDDEGKDILILDHKFDRTENDPFYDDRLLGVISLMAAIEDLDKEEMIERIKNHGKA